MRDHTDFQRFLLLEALSGQSPLAMVYRHDDQPVWDYLFAETEWAPFQTEGPVIVQVGRHSELYREAQQALWQSTDMTGLILVSAADLQHVAAWARQGLIIRLNNTRKALLRFYDPWVWHQLAPVRKEQSNPVRRVIYRHGSGSATRWRVSRHPEPVGAGTPALLNPEQQKALGLN